MYIQINSRCVIAFSLDPLPLIGNSPGIPIRFVNGIQRKNIGAPKMQNNWWTHKVLIFLILLYFCIGFVLLPVYFSIFPLCDNNSCRSYSLLKAIAKVRKTYRYRLKEQKRVLIIAIAIVGGKKSIE